MDRLSVYEKLKEISQDSSLNLVRFPADYRAEQAGEAFAREALGESGRGAGAGVGHAIYASGKVTGAAWSGTGPKLTVFLTLLDKTHRQGAKEGGFSDTNDRAFGWATRTVADASNPSRNLPYLEVCGNFKTWERVELAGLPVFPALEGFTPEEFAAEIIALQQLGQKIAKLANKVSTLKAKVGKGRFEAHGFSVEYFPPSMSTMIVDSDGIKVDRISRLVKNHHSLRVSLPELPRKMEVAELLPEYLGKLIAGETDAAVILPVAMAGLEVLRKEYELRYSVARPFEGRFIEDSLKETAVTIGGVTFEIVQTDATESDMPADTGTKLKTGEYREIVAPGRNGRWELAETPATIPA